MNTVDAKLVIKPWGYELWIADGIRTPYASKKILFNAGKQTSMQVHKYKFETNYVISGTGFLLLSDELFDIESYLQGTITQKEIDLHINNLKCIPLIPGTTFDVSPGYVHRVIATTELVFFETSTCELDDVIRLQDDTNRINGRIENEHTE